MKNDPPMVKLYIYSLDVTTPGSAGSEPSGTGGLTKNNDGEEEGPLDLIAQFNPKEIQIDRTVPWQKQSANNASGADLEFTGAESRSMSLELFFDTYETGKSVHTEYVDKLERMAIPYTPAPEDPKKAKEWHRRPHLIQLAWGEVFPGKFTCVIESLSVKYTMFSPKGLPLRATVNLKVKEATSAIKGSATAKKPGTTTPAPKT